MKTLDLAIQTGLPVLLWGYPEGGMSSYIHSLGKALGIPVYHVITSLRRPSDFSGFPMVTEEGIKLVPPGWAKQMLNLRDGILYLDDLLPASVEVRSAALRVAVERIVGDITLPDKIFIVASANVPFPSTKDSLPPNISSRFVHFDWTPNVHDWVEGMTKGWPVPKVEKLPSPWDKLIPLCRMIVASFIKSHPDLAYRMTSTSRGWPNFRSWNMAATLLAAAFSVRASLEVAVDLVSRVVGEDASKTFRSWLESMDLPGPEAFIYCPIRCQSRGNVARDYVIIARTVGAVFRSYAPERVTQACNVIRSMCKEASPDLIEKVEKILLTRTTAFEDMDTLAEALFDAIREGFCCGSNSGGFRS